MSFNHPSATHPSAAHPAALPRGQRIVSPAQITRLGRGSRGALYVQAGERRAAAAQLRAAGVDAHWCLGDLLTLRRPEVFDHPGDLVFLWAGPGAPASSWPLSAAALEALSPGALGAGRASERTRLTRTWGPLTQAAGSVPQRARRVLAACEDAARAPHQPDYPCAVNQGEAQLALSDLLAHYPEALREVATRADPALRGTCETHAQELSALGTLSRTLLRELDRHESRARRAQA